MKFSAKLGFLGAIAYVGALPAYAAPSGPLYIDDASGNIGTVDLGTGIVTVLGGSGVALTDIGFTANGNLYGTSFTGFYSISKTTGAATLIGNYGAAGGGINALVGDGTRLLAASNATTSLYSIAPTPFAITTLSGSSQGASAGDLAFTLAGGSLYETQSSGDLVRITISGSSIASTLVGNMGNSFVYGLATGDDGVTYAVSGTEIYKLNLSTATLTPFLDYSGHGLGAANGTAFLAEGRIPTPEPASLSLLGAGLLGVYFVRRRHS